ncbi:hypothetical protein [Thermomonospora umbrina]|uniref:Uncharacterized protein n=1 Tax=Thermomonospora umbrina TaxID=111806 RepID=A0A3D9SYC4_9ACTN|nr:hypothetical protein [Thermomonospora umbrina]REF00963.1 hypothetical protein DFJ69_6561 [Thermomonospora umbrina]
MGGSALERDRRVERACHLLGAALIGAGLFHLAVFAVDGGPWAGPVSWRKPATFGLSFGLTLITVTWVASYLPLGGRLRAWLLGVFAVDCLVEVGGITLQAWRRVPSHVNRETPFDSAVSTVLAVGGGVLIVVLGVLAVAAFRPNPRVPADMRLALRAGFTTLVIALGTGAAMIARGVINVNTGHQQEAYEVVGFLKAAHGVSLHGVLVLPALAALLAFTGWNEGRRTRVVAVAAAGYGVAIAAALASSAVT